MSHLLDRPVWNALSSRQASFSRRRGAAARFAPDVGAFVAAEDDSEAALTDLGELVAEEGFGWLLQAQASPTVPGVLVESVASCVQMVATRLEAPAPAGLERARRLTDREAEEMLALATLTEPGPFFPHTHRLGEFWGVIVDGHIAAMAGERMRLDGFTEVSGVCTHPDHRGRGFAATLTWLVTSRILARGEAAFLHSYASNAPAIALYERLGFRIRSEMTATVLVAEAELGGA